MYDSDSPYDWETVAGALDYLKYQTRCGAETGPMGEERADVALEMIRDELKRLTRAFDPSGICHACDAPLHRHPLQVDDNGTTCPGWVSTRWSVVRALLNRLGDIESPAPRYFLTEDGRAGVKVDQPAQGPEFEGLLEALRQVHPSLQEVDRETYLEADRRSMITFDEEKMP